MNQDTLFQSHRPVVMGANGMVAAAHPLASVAGLRTLMEGGNAFDAAVATVAALNVVEPYMSGMGGVGCLLAYVAKEERTRVLNFTGRAPAAADPSRFTEENKERGILSVLVPGNVAGWLTLHETYGRLDRERLFQSAIDYAEEGFPITHLKPLPDSGRQAPGGRLTPALEASWSLKEGRPRRVNCCFSHSWPRA